jgi:putative NADH-flavin reductase
MRLFLLGASGKTGRHVTELALARGHSVTAFVRSPGKMGQRHPLLSVVRGDPRSSDELARALPGHDAVLSTLGVRPPQAFRRHTLVEDCAASTIAAMERAGVERYVLLSAAVLFPLPGLRFVFFRWLLKHIARDLGAAEKLVQATPLAWTIVRPPRLVERADERYRSARDALPVDGFVMSFRAVAAFMLDAAEARTHVRETIGLAGALG